MKDASEDLVNAPSGQQIERLAEMISEYFSADHTHPKDETAWQA